jgi:LysR family transcriptional activator of glutamate synthase operon
VNLNQLYYFKTIAKLEHSRLAAEELRISQPSLSVSISNLEDELGVKLFEKKGRNIKLTSYGKKFLIYVEKSLEILEKGIADINEIKKNEIKIAYVFSLSLEYIPKIIKDFFSSIDKSFKIHFNLKQDLTSEIIKGLKEFKYDIGFCSKVEDEKNIIFEPIFEQKLVLLVYKGHPLAKKKIVSLEEIKDYDLISYTKNSGLGQFIEKILKDKKILPKIKFEAENEQGIMGLVAQGFGIAIIGKTSILKPTNIVQVNISDIEKKRYIYLAYLKTKKFELYQQNFIDYIKRNNNLKKEKKR